MKKTLLKALVVASVLIPAVAFTQTGKTKPTTATYIMKEEIDAVSKSEQTRPTVDENTKVVDLGYENFTVGVIHRGSTRKPPQAPAGGGAAAAAAPSEPCGRQMATLPPGGTPGGIVHDFQTEGYYIVSGGGTMFTDGYIANGKHSTQNNAPGGPNGPSCGGMAYDVKKVVVKTGDVVIVPPGVVHGWSDIPDHVDYLSFRPSQNVLGAGWVNPTIKK
jgi:mannose-6-phosphate isomerase-like protein (cupin superfamily)